MKTTTLIICSSFVLAACQTIPKSYNGVSGYQIERQTEQTAILSYTLAAKKNLDLNTKRLQAACQKVLKQPKDYKITVLSEQEIINPQNDKPDQGVQIGKSRATFGLSNIPDHTQADNQATNQALETRPDTLRVIRYSCE
jgi:hypothetical protein